MTEISIDNSKLPGVKEVCRDFAVLEDHTLAHSLQEQEIEHHLATNIQRNRLVKTDLQVAKQLQEEEEIQAKSRNKTHPRDLELLDCEIAQEIQDKLVIEAERRRRQEEKDEDIARLLQEKEEKRRRKYCSSSPAAQEDPYYLDHEGHRKGRHKEYRSEIDRPHRHERVERQRIERNELTPETCPSNSVQQLGRSAEPRPCTKEDHYDIQKHDHHYSRPSSKKEKPQRPPPPRTNRPEDHIIERTNGVHSNEHLSTKSRSHSHDLYESVNRREQDVSNGKTPRSYKEGDYDNERHRRRTPSPCHERHLRDSGHRSKGVRDSPHRKHPAGVRNQEEKDADLAKRLQERERKANMVDFQAAQLAQDEEIARYLMEKEEKAYKKSKGREKMPDKRRPEEWEPNMHDHMRPRSREGHEQHRSRSDKPYRPLPPPPPDGDDDRDHDYVNLSQHHSPRSNPKSQSSHKG
ncbi:coiled-coil domain-containing protein 50 [Rhinophrynus dorsalis]